MVEQSVIHLGLYASARKILRRTARSTQKDRAVFVSSPRGWLQAWAWLAVIVGLVMILSKPST